MGLRLDYVFASLRHILTCAALILFRYGLKAVTCHWPRDFCSYTYGATCTLYQPVLARAFAVGCFFELSALVGCIVACCYLCVPLVNKQRCLMSMLFVLAMRAIFGLLGTSGGDGCGLALSSACSLHRHRLGRDHVLGGWRFCAACSLRIARDAGDTC